MCVEVRETRFSESIIFYLWKHTIYQTNIQEVTMVLGLR